MDALITNLSSNALFVPGPQLELAASGSAGDAKTWGGVSIASLDNSSALKQMVVDGKVSVTLSDNTQDAAPQLGAQSLAQYALADLPVGFEGRVVFVTDGRKTGEGAAAGTGVPAYWSAAAWHVFFDDSVVVA
jgi:hypothetical protein